MYNERSSLTSRQKKKKKNWQIDLQLKSINQKSQIWQEVDCNIPWQRGWDERFFRKEFEKDPPKTFPRICYFQCIIAKNLKEGYSAVPICNPDKHKLTPASMEKVFVNKS